MPDPNNTTDRGYGWEHQQLRADWARHLAKVRTIDCARCGQPIHHGDQWDLGHTDDRTAYTGPEHRYCNRADGGRRRHKPTPHRRRIL